MTPDLWPLKQEVALCCGGGEVTLDVVTWSNLDIVMLHLMPFVTIVSKSLPYEISAFCHDKIVLLGV